MFLFTSLVYSQQIKINVANVNWNKATLYSLSGEKTTFIDSIYSSNPGEFVNQPKNVLHNGIYRLKFDKNKWIDFIYDGKDISLRTDANNVLDSLRVITSESNKLFYSFIRLNKTYKTKTELLQFILARYPKDDNYYQATKEKILQIQEDYLHFVNVTSQTNPSSFIARYVRSAQLPVVNAETQPDKQLEYLKSHALDSVDFRDDDLIYSDAFTSKTIEYLTYYRNPNLPKELLEKEFMKAVDTVLNKAKVNEIAYKHIVEYLLDGFKKFGLDDVINYIVENYVIKDDICLDEKLEKALDRRIQQARNFKIGNTVPDITLPDSTGKIIDLNKINSKTLVIFYASWCPHCQAIIPQISEFYKNQKEKKFDVLAVSIDTSRIEWLDFTRKNDLDWINISDLKGWDGEATKEYYIYATPTMFLVDKEGKIVGMPKDIEEIKNSLN